MKQTVAFTLVSVMFVTGLSSFAFAQTRPAKPTVASTLPANWQQIDQRFVFFTVQLASVETSIDAVNKALKAAGYHQGVKQQQSAQHQKANDLMDRNGGGPVRWDAFYGKTAEAFYHATDYDVAAAAADSSGQSLAYVSVHSDVASRPPQFDYIYRANQNAQERAEDEIAKLGGKIDALVARRQQLEGEQAASWSKIAFQGLVSRKLNSKPFYRFDLKVDGAADVDKQRQEVIRAGATFVRTVLRAIADAEDAVTNDPAATFDALNHAVAKASAEFNDRVLHSPKLALDASDANTALGRIVASTDRLADVTKNISESYRDALDGDKTGDEQRKQTFRGYTQQALFDCATNVLGTAQYLLSLGREWNAQVDVDKPIAATQPVLAIAADPAHAAAPAEHNEHTVDNPAPGKGTSLVPTAIRGGSAIYPHGIAMKPPAEEKVIASDEHQGRVGRVGLGNIYTMKIEAKAPLVKIATTALYFTALQPADKGGAHLVAFISTDYGKKWIPIATYETADFKAAKRRDGWFVIDLGLFYRKNADAELDELQVRFESEIGEAEQEVIEVDRVNWVRK